MKYLLATCFNMAPDETTVFLLHKYTHTAYMIVEMNIPFYLIGMDNKTHTHKGNQVLAINLFRTIKRLFMIIAFVVNGI